MRSTQRCSTNSNAPSQSSQADTSVRVILLTGSGERAFAAGADIRASLETDASSGRAASERGQQVFLRDRALRKAGDRVRERRCAGRRMRAGTGMHLPHCERAREARIAGAEARADSGLRRNAAAAAAHRQKRGVAADADRRCG